MTTTVAVDIGPLAGPRTGIGHAVAAIVDELERQPNLTVVPYLTSFRGHPGGGARRLPIPAAVAHRLWARADHPRMDRWLGPAQLIHGTNYVVPPSRLPRLVSVYDCWFLQHLGSVHPDIARAGHVLQRAVASGAAIHTTSQASADALRDLFPGAAIEVVPLAAIPLDAPPEHPPIAELDGRPFVLSVATLERRKNLPRLVEAFGLIAGDRTDLHLVLAGGDGDDRSAVDTAIDRLAPSVASRVLLTGYASPEVRSWLLHHARLLAYPSLDEGFGLPLLDAMQARIPIVAARAGAIPEVAGDAACYAAPSDVVGLAEQLARAHDDSSLRRHLVEVGSERLRSFSWSRTACGLVDVYRRLAEGDGAR